MTVCDAQMPPMRSLSRFRYRHAVRVSASGRSRDNVTMRYRRAIEKLRLLAEACQSTTRLPLQEPFLREAYVFGEVLNGADPVERLQVAFTLDLPPEEVPWCSQPPGTPWLVDSLRLDKGGYAYWWRSRHQPVWNHVIHEPVRF